MLSIKLSFATISHNNLHDLCTTHLRAYKGLKIIMFNGFNFTLSRMNYGETLVSLLNYMTLGRTA